MEPGDVPGFRLPSFVTGTFIVPLPLSVAPVLFVKRYVPAGGAPLSAIGSGVANVNVPPLLIDPPGYVTMRRFVGELYVVVTPPESASGPARFIVAFDPLIVAVPPAIVNVPVG